MWNSYSYSYQRGKKRGAEHRHWEGDRLVRTPVNRLPPRQRRQCKKYKFEQLYQLVLKHLYSKYSNSKSNYTWVTAEEIACHFQCKVHFVTQIFQKLKLQGVLGTRENFSPWYEREDGWRATTYRLDINQLRRVAKG